LMWRPGRLASDQRLILVSTIMSTKLSVRHRRHIAGF